MEQKIIVARLRDIGFPITGDATAKQIHEAVHDFQRGFTFGPKLVRDGYVGKKTAEALDLCIKRDGRCSEHFRFAEFESKGNTDYTIKVAGALVLGLEEVRLHVGAFGILSGYRDPAHNAAVGSTPNSQHLYGNAIDPNPVLPLAVVIKVKRFSGIGTDKTIGGPVRHVDVRHVGPNTTGSTIDRPARWIYA